MVNAGWPEADARLFSLTRQALIADFITLPGKPGFVNSYFVWMRDNLQAKAGCGFDWIIKRDIFIRAKEGNFSNLEFT